MKLGWIVGCKSDADVLRMARHRDQSLLPSIQIIALEIIGIDAYCECFRKDQFLAGQQCEECCARCCDEDVIAVSAEVRHIGFSGHRSTWATPKPPPGQVGTPATFSGHSNHIAYKKNALQGSGIAFPENGVFGERVDAQCGSATNSCCHRFTPIVSRSQNRLNL